MSEKSAEELEYWTTHVKGKPVIIRPLAAQKFEVPDNSSLDYLESNGYVVYKNVATDEQLQKALLLFWTHLETESANQINRNDPTTWTTWPGRYHPTGVITDMGVGQSPFLWYIRGLPKVVEIFSRIWKTDRLLTSFDGCGTFRPPQVNPAFKTKKGWYHADQNGYKKKGRECVQGLLNLLPSGEFDGGLVVVPKSHKIFEEVFSKYKGLTKSDFVNFDRDLPELWDNPSCVYPVKLILEPGDFALWDSRTVHCNHPVYIPQNAEGVPSTNLRRLAAYVCMTPANFAKNLNHLVGLRLNAFKSGVTSNHWPHEFYASSKPYTTKTFHPDRRNLTSLQNSLLTGEEHEIQFE